MLKNPEKYMNDFARFDDLESFLALKEVGGNIEANTYDYTPVLTASRYGSERVFNYLIGERVPIGAVYQTLQENIWSYIADLDDGALALRFAIKLIDYVPAEITKMMLNHRNHNQWTPLFRACYRGHIALIQLMIKHGADMYVRDHYFNICAAGVATHPMTVVALLAEGFPLPLLLENLLGNRQKPITMGIRVYRLLKAKMKRRHNING